MERWHEWAFMKTGLRCLDAVSDLRVSASVVRSVIVPHTQNDAFFGR